MKNFLKTFKEELVVIPAFALLIYLYQWFMGSYFPESAQFDLASEVENIIWALIKLVVFTSASWLAIRVVFPKQFKFMIDDYQNSYKGMTQQQKRYQYSVTFFGFLLILALLA